MNLDFNKAAEKQTQTNTSYVVKLKPGIHDHCIVTSFIYYAPVDKAPYVEVTFAKEDGGGIFKEKFYMSEGAMPFSLLRIKELVEAMGQTVPENATVEALNEIMVGKAVALRLYGEEVIIANDGKAKAVIVSKLSPIPFCVPAGQASLLTYNENKAIKRLPVMPEPVTDAGTTDDMPF